MYIPALITNLHPITGSSGVQTRSCINGKISVQTRNGGNGKIVVRTGDGGI